MCDNRFFDACLFDDAALRAALPEALCGAVIWNHATSAPKAERRTILLARKLNHLVGENDPRFPRSADVISLNLPHEELLRHLKEPQASRERVTSRDRKGAGMAPEWFPLCGISRENKKRTILHIAARDFRSLARGISHLARAYPNVTFLIDPFLSGKESKWEAGVCLADEANVWITTRGLYGADTLWPDRAEREALHFVVGEVGAGKLLFASGMNATQLSAQTPSPSAWLKEIAFLDAAQRELILWRNASSLFTQSSPGF
ncbi:MAG TPA: amidohydrolase family protein [Planctomycetota bacterium]|nr:amidohydrolase family protein [Planctomycetota bacterium]